jgi:TetR/AcrR family transcriptional repressor of nem operon
MQQKAVVLGNAPHVEAEILMATVHGAMLSARAYGDTTVFGSIMDPLLERMAAKK